MHKTVGCREEPLWDPVQPMLAWKRTQNDDGDDDNNKTLTILETPETLRHSHHYKRPQGIASLSDYAITFHYVDPQTMYVFDYFLYHLRPYGIMNKPQELNIIETHHSTTIEPPLIFTPGENIIKGFVKTLEERKKQNSTTQFVLEKFSTSKAKKDSAVTGYRKPNTPTAFKTTIIIPGNTNANINANNDNNNNNNNNNNMNANVNENNKNSIENTVKNTDVNNNEGTINNNAETPSKKKKRRKKKRRVTTLPTDT